MWGRRGYYWGAAGVAIVALVAGPLAYSAMTGSPDCRGAAVLGADVGGPFRLVSETGATVTETDVLRQPALVYFGYTFCPDVCPIDAARNAEAVDLLEADGHEVTPVFVSVDPQRDTPEVLAEFTDYMHPRMVGLTGSDEQVDAAADAYRVYYNRHPAEDDYYLVDHSTFTYLMLPGVGLVDYFRRDDPPETVAERVACHLNST